MPDKTFITKTLQKLVQINSVNPSLEESGGGEKEISKCIGDILDQLGITYEVDEIEPGRMNVTAKIPGSGNGKSLILNAHTDTVGVAGMDDPFSGTIKDSKLYGRGSYDMKGSIAAILGTAKKIVDEKIDMEGDLILSFVADEEYESMGAKRFVEKYNADACIVTEPTDLQICLAHRGFGVFKIVTEGKTAHGGNHHLGVDANSKMGLFLSEIDALSKQLPNQKKHKLCGSASVHVPLVKGGNSLFIYANECIAEVERRTIPGETEEAVIQELNQIIKKILSADTDFKATVQTVLWREPYEIDQSKQIVTDLKNASEKVLGEFTGYTGHTWWEDSAIFGESGIETVIIGPRGGGIHESVEWVELDSVADLSEILYINTINYCNRIV